MNKELVIVFVKNAKLGKVKTRLAKTIGNQAAFETYKALVSITETILNEVLVDKRVYFSETIEEDEWNGYEKFVQKGTDLGARMENAFKKAFDDGYNRIVLIGSDLPDITSKHIKKGLDTLNHYDSVFGPALDGGYYLLGLSKMCDFVFSNKPWSKSNLLKETTNELVLNNVDYNMLEVLNDIDTFQDLEASRFYQKNKALQERISILNR